MASKEHLALVRAVNESKTELEYVYNSGVLAGFRMGLEFQEIRVDYIGCDIEIQKEYPGEDMTAGVLIRRKYSQSPNANQPRSGV